jgi:hypothetical protein
MKPTMSGSEPQPPWVIHPSINPGDEPYWLTEEGKTWLKTVFLPFYDNLTDQAQLAYCTRWNAPPAWFTLFLHPELDEAFADADEEETGTRVEPLNYRKIFGVSA